MIGALAWFELRRALGRRTAVHAFVLFNAGLAVGHWDHWHGDAANGSAFFGYAYLMGLVLLMRYGLAADRSLRFDEYLLVNRARPAAYITAKILAMGALLAGYGVLGAVMETLFSGGGVGDALWIALAWTLAAWLFSPLVMLAEALLDTSIPLAPVLLLFVIVVITEFLSRHTLTAVEILGVRALAPGDWATLTPLAVRGVIAAPACFLGVGALVRLTLPRC